MRTLTAPILLAVAAIAWPGCGSEPRQSPPAGDGIYHTAFLQAADEPKPAPPLKPIPQVADPSKPFIELPKGMTVAPGKFLTVDAKTNGKTVRWRLRADDLALFPVDRTKDSLSATVIGYVEGSYELEAWTALGDEATDIAICVIKVDDGKDDTPLPPTTPPPTIPTTPNTPPVTPPTDKATAATYVYEKDLTAIPGPVLSALNKLNRERGILATAIEADAKDGTGDVPEQYKVPLAAAKQAGLPALVVTAGIKVLSVVKDPKSEQSVLDAVK